MQVIYQNKDEEEVSERADTLDFDICTERIYRCVKGECVSRFRVRRLGIHISSIEKRVWEKR